MPFDLETLLTERAGEGLTLHRRHGNHQLVRVLQLTGFDRNYERAEGSWIYDDQGREYLDFLAGFGVFALGRNHPAVKAALHQALDADLPHLVQFDTPLLAGILAERLCALTDDLDRCFFTNSGAESIESAIKFSHRFTGRPRIVYCEHAFHGLTNGSLALNGGREFRDGFEPILPSTTPVPFGDLAALQAELDRGDVAAFVIEPIQGKTVHVASDEYLRAAAEACRQAGTLLVADEVQAGLGRTGAMFSYQHSGIRPDIVTVAKALSGGFVPVGATLCRSDVWKSVYDSVDQALVHSTTFGQNSLAMVAGLATLSVMEDEGLVVNAERTGRRLTDGIRSLQRDHDVIADVRGRGLMIGIEFDRPARGRMPLWGAMERARSGMFSQLVVGPLFNDHRILTQVAADHINVVKLLPPLVAGDKEADVFLDALDDVLGRARRIGASTVRMGANVVKRLARPEHRRS